MYSTRWNGLWIPGVKNSGYHGEKGVEETTWFQRVSTPAVGGPEFSGAVLDSIVRWTAFFPWALYLLKTRFRFAETSYE